MKKIFGFQIGINNKTVCRAGFENENSIVTCILDSVRRKDDDSEELNISITGLNSETHQSSDWYNNKLQEGDKISIEIISNNFDTPTSVRKVFSEEQILDQKLKTYQKLKEELKDYLKE